MKFLIVGDIVGSPGRKTLEKYLEKNKKKYDFIIVNGENAAAGFGITTKIAEQLFDMGVDVITSGNHIWDKREIYTYLDKEPRLLRPLNYPKGVPGNGYIVCNKNGVRIAVVNLQGRVFMPEIRSPFEVAMDEIPKHGVDADIIIVDFHAEATSEKIAMMWHLNGEISLLFGTHTHVLTADERILPSGTGYITDIGMTGSFDGVIGTEKSKVLEKFLTSLPVRFEVSNTGERINGIEVDINENTGKCIDINRINLRLDAI